jgi:hypothetical protein
MPLLSLESEKSIERQLNLLLQIIYESENCSVSRTPKKAGQREELVFSGKFNGTFSRGDGVHGASMPALALALGYHEFANQDTFQTTHNGLGNIPYEIPEGETIANVRDKLLLYVLERFAISRQNYQYFLRNKTFHPLSGKGATESSVLCALPPPLDEVTIGIDSDAEGKAVIDIEGDHEFFAELELMSEDYSVTLGNPAIERLLLRLKEQQINYQGVIPVSEDGEIFLALRKARSQRHILGYATCGGHCNDPFHPLVAAAHDLEEEFGIKLKAEARLSTIEMADKIGDVAIFTVAGEHLDTSHFSPEVAEFVSRTGDVLSFKEIRDRKLPLRNIPSLDVYLKYQERKLQEIVARKWNCAKVEISTNCVVEENGIVQFPTADFGAIEFYGENLIALQDQLQRDLGGIARIDEKKKCVVIDDLNPKQIIDFIEGKRIKEDLEKYRSDKVQKAKEHDAALKLQKPVRTHLARRDLAAKAHVSIEQRTQQNILAIKQDLAKDVQGADLFSPEEKKIFAAVCNLELFLFHATSKSGALAIDSSRRILSVRGRYIRDLSERPQDDHAYLASGMEHQIFFSIGTHAMVPDYLKGEREVLYEMRLDDLLKDRNFCDNAWLGENLVRYFSGNQRKSLVEIGNVIAEVSHKHGKDLGYKNYAYQSQVSDQYVAFSRDFGADICESRKMQEFLAYSFVERMRHMGGSAREYMMRHPDDIEFIGRIFNKLVSGSNFMVHVPDSFSIDNPHVDCAKISYSNSAAHLDVLSAVDKVNLAALQELKERDPNLARNIFRSCTMYEQDFSYIANHAIMIGDKNIVGWLAENGFFDEVVADFKENAFGGISIETKDLMNSLEIFFRRSAGDIETAASMLKIVFADVIKRGITSELKPYFTANTMIIFDRLMVEISGVAAEDSAEDVDVDPIAAAELPSRKSSFTGAEQLQRKVDLASGRAASGSSISTV